MVHWVIAKLTTGSSVADESAVTLERLGPFESRERAASGRQAVLARYRDRPGFEFYIDLPEIEVDTGQSDYYAYYDNSQEDEIYEILTAPPVEEFP